MVFSFFKKQPQKMPERAAARPRAPLPDMKLNPPKETPSATLAEPLPDLEFSVEPPVQNQAVAQQGARPAVKTTSKPQRKIDLAMTMDEFEDEFTESSVMAIDVAHDIDPLQADVEQVAVLFANDQDAAARSVLESLLPAYSGEQGVRLWRLLFDLLQILGDRAAFDRFGLEFAQRFELSPPTWRVEQCLPKGGAVSAQRFVLQGVLTGDDPSLLQKLASALQQPATLQVDFSRLAGCDDGAAGVLADMLEQARRRRRKCVLSGIDATIRRLDERLKVGEAEHQPSWRLLLELLQWHGTQAHFEERAVDFAVTFELSPPSWESVPEQQGEPEPVSGDAGGADVHYLSGDLKNERFQELQVFIEQNEHPILDFASVRRVDFFSAGQLVNRLAPFKAAGKEVVIRSPNHLVAELMAVVGLNKQARIIVPKS